MLNSNIDFADGGTHSAIDLLLHSGVKNVLLKLGSAGCVIARGTMTKQRVPAFSVDAVDTTGAGDAFNAGFSVGLMRGYTVEESAVFASAVAAIRSRGPVRKRPCLMGMRSIFSCYNIPSRYAVVLNPATNLDPS